MVAKSVTKEQKKAGGALKEKIVFDGAGEISVYF